MAETESPFPIFLTTKQVAAYLVVSRQYVNKLISKRRGLKVYRIGNRLRFRKDELLDWIEAQKF